MYVILDSEMNGLKPTKVHVIVVKEKPANVIRIFTQYPFLYKGAYTETFDDFVELTKTTYTKYSIHNGIHYDVPNIRRLIPNVRMDWRQVFDTLVASRLANQERLGGHSMANWGTHLGLPKVEHDDWENLSEDMITRCIGDVELGDLIDQAVHKELQGFSKFSLELEHEVCEICRRIEDHGFMLDYEQCSSVLAEVDGLKNQLQYDLSQRYPRLPKLKRLVEYKITAKGVLHSNTTKPLGEHGNTIVGPYSLIDWEEFNPGSRQQIAEHLMRQGWKPTKFTEPSKNHPKGQPKVDETTLIEAAEALPAAKDIAQFLMLGKRSSQISSWLELYNHDTGRVHGRIHHIGTRTHRASHADPNLAQVPAVPHYPDGHPRAKQIIHGLEGTYAYECRNVWTVPKGYSLVGVDASAIQLVILADAMGNEEFSKAVAFGDKKQGTDVHSVNRNTLRTAIQDLLGSSTDISYISRDTAKTFCVPKDTEILTPSGYKKRSDIVVGDKCFSYNPSTKQMEEDTILGIHDTFGEVFNYGSSSWSFNCTADHRWYGERRRQRGHRGEHYFEECFFSLEDKGEHKVFTAATFDDSQRKKLDLTTQEVAAIGWLLSDGWWKWSTPSRRKNDRGIAHSIVQSEKKYYKHILKLFDGLVVSDSKATKNDCHFIRLNTKWLRTVMTKCGFVGLSKYEVDWESFVLQLSKENLKQFVASFWQAEGWSTRRGVKMLSQKDPTVTRGIVLALNLLGYDTRVHLQKNKQYVITMRTRKHIHRQILKKQSLGNQPVWCVTTTRGTWYARQGMTTTITGNCYAFLLGAGGTKVDQILGTFGIGNKVKELFVKRTPGLGELQNSLREACHFEGRIRNIDGRYFPCDNPHFALAFVLQGYEQVIMKMAMVKLQRWIDETGIDAHIVAWVHDEFQIEVRNENDLPKRVSDQTVKFIEEVGAELKLKCFLTGEGHVASTWAKSH